MNVLAVSIVEKKHSMSRVYWVEPVFLMNIKTVERIYERIVNIDGVSGVAVSYDGITVTCRAPSLWCVVGPEVLTAVVDSISTTDCCEMVSICVTTSDKTTVLMLPYEIFKVKDAYVDIERFLGFVTNDNVPDRLSGFLLN